MTFFSSTHFWVTGTKDLLVFSDGKTSWEPVIRKEVKIDVEPHDEPIEYEDLENVVQFFIIDGELRYSTDDTPPGLNPPSDDTRLLGIRRR